jgi:hypothetical protein
MNPIIIKPTLLKFNGTPFKLENGILSVFLGNESQPSI